VLVHGYLQGGWSTWEGVAQRLAGMTEKTIVVVNRIGHEGGTRPKKLGRMTVGEQSNDLSDIAESLRSCGVIGEDQVIDWVGHSLGGLLAEMQIERDPRNAGYYVGVAPVQPTPLAIFTNPIFWIGGVAGLWGVVRSVLTGEGVRYWRWMSKWLFTGTQVTNGQFEAFRGDEQPDSGWIFLQCLLFFGWGAGTTLTRARRNGWRGKATVIHFSHDHILPTWGMKRMRTIGHADQLHMLNSAHCWWTHDAERKYPEIATMIAHALRRNP
jgi:pimeloyl-ACP methyl ester carboxylesterase